jgi:hypothetical protein
MPCEMLRSPLRSLGLHQAQIATRNGNSLCKKTIIDSWHCMREHMWFVHNNFELINATREKNQSPAIKS